MNVDSFQQSLNQSLQILILKIEQFVGVAVQAATLLQRQFAEATRNWSSPIEFSPLQLTLLKVLLVLLLGTAGLIAYSWRVYGNVITEKFVRASTLKEIEELKLSVAKLKLPKEHSPRI
ncbi:uncharacterized protein LOC128867493 isoform X1 [Anastrepha ludens]|uniref:uncharacterized protein LOC128867493 isoform X1 n=1 Tax=Anastrepha ludens TaxID=28586 RepID=UPI0023B0EB5E|nr:uncharacterized protein LOC128867493 isoform X1 [Anastrepha ludens]XP_053964725.1 uncharacterized protein LOC128867493 isoform X1 [Anastrepha ludens]